MPRPKKPKPPPKLPAIETYEWWATHESGAVFTMGARVGKRPHQSWFSAVELPIWRWILEGQYDGVLPPGSWEVELVRRGQRMHHFRVVAWDAHAPRTTANRLLGRLMQHTWALDISSAAHVVRLEEEIRSMIAELFT